MFYMAIEENEQEQVKAFLQREDKKPLAHKIPGKKNPSVAELREYAEKKFNTTRNTYEDFPVGTTVQVIAPCVDFTFFNFEIGKVIGNLNCYLGIIVEFEDESKWNFEPQHLRRLG